MRDSHRQFRHPDYSSVITVSGNPGIDLPEGTLKAILKAAGIDREGRTS
ncbi:MAG: type II toxin-antitoxin system HicA family toxin [Bryobacteraceae bacterium]|nr:type II toxin-antitoxin system HicA family toxin [Bryobacteraceae bacterium]